jgi:tRNA-modifying protein YgfZ
LAATDGRLKRAEASTMTQLFNPESGALFDLSSRVKLRVGGADAPRFLNGQITNDLRKVTASATIQASVLNAKGKVNANVFVSAEGDSFLVDADPELREELPLRLEKYIIADDVQIEDATDRFALFHVTGDPTPAIQSGRIIPANRFGCSGWDIWTERAEQESARGELSAAFVPCNEECAEVFRVERGIPRWGRELTDQIIPTEANLEASSIDYFKGCYIGQEVISRIKMSGQTNKRLCGLISLSDAPLGAEMRLVPAEDEQKEIGWITSALRSPRLQKEIALGYVKRGFNSVGSRLFALSPNNADRVPIEIVALPFL